MLVYICLKINCTQQFALIRFHFFLTLLVVFFHSFCLCTCIPYRAPLVISKFLYMPFPEHDINRYHLPCFFHHVHAWQNVPFSPSWASIFLVFASVLEYGSIRTHPNRFVPTITHLHLFLPNTPKHDVRGNFPGHRSQNMSWDPINSPCLPCFCVAHAPCDPTHPYAPTLTHFNLFIPICPPNYMYTWCNLIKK